MHDCTEYSFLWLPFCPHKQTVKFPVMKSGEKAKMKVKFIHGKWFN